MQENTFEIYNASAGSGKTYTLVKQYLKTILQANSNHYFKQVLAITFTNKAVAEMKSRILDNLNEFASAKNTSDFPELLCILAQELNTTPKLVQEKSEKIYTEILNNYAAFDVVTIDTFTHRIIRTFALDLKIPQNFEVALDTDEILQLAVNNLLSKIGKDNKLTKVLLDYTIQKIDDDKSWEIGTDLYKAAKVLLNENDIPYFESLKEKSLDDFDKLNKIVLDKIVDLKKQIIKKSGDILVLFHEEGLTKDDFDRGSVYNHFANLNTEKISVKWEAKWQEKVINGGTLYKKTTPENNKITIEKIQPDIATAFTETKSLIKEISFLKNIQKHIIPLSVINLVAQEINQIKDEESILLISEFNKIIANEIKDQPAPFIYERLGERYKNYFIDEFQDTSVMQWENLIPLAENTLSNLSMEKVPHSLMLVGDAKQAIYRWRGGKPEQFINLYEGKSPFYLRPNLIKLDTNYRSYDEVIHFNNNFFTHLAKKFGNPDHQNLYTIGNNQNVNSKTGGYIQIDFIENNNKEESIKDYQEKVLDNINFCLENGFELKDICVITRKKSEGIAIADFLSANNVDVLSSESLLLSKSPEVNFTVALLDSLSDQTDKAKLLTVLFFLYNHLDVKTNEHDFYSAILSLNYQQFLSFLGEQHKIYLQLDWIRTLSLYELTETIIREFRLVKTSDAYLQYFLDEVYSFTNKRNSGIIGFLEYWNEKKDKLSIIAPEGENAVSLMTIHKSKGLEFSVVIFPFADLNIYKEVEPKSWFPLSSSDFNNFSHTQIGFNKSLEDFNATGKKIFEDRRSQLELDNINLLYVALTRAKEQLYIVSMNLSDKNRSEKDETYNSFLIHYLQESQLWNKNETSYSFGLPERISNNSEKTTHKELPFISSPKSSHNLAIITKSGYLWGTEQEKAIEKGNLIHLILSKIKYHSEIDFALEEALLNGIISLEQKKELFIILEKLTENELLAPYFGSEYKVYNEKKILTPSGAILIPDRVVLKEKTVTIIDYKTGSHHLSHENQINNYANAFINMGFDIDKKILIYLDDHINIKEVN